MQHAYQQGVLRSCIADMQRRMALILLLIADKGSTATGGLKYGRLLTP
jgi:hypothetical protein